MWLQIVIISFCLILSPLFAYAEEHTTSSASATTIKKVTTPHATIALALGGGGIRGAAHIGVLRVFEREGIPIDYIAGSSMGAIIGGLYAAGVPLDEIEGILEDKSLQKAYAPGTITKRLLLNFVGRCACFFKDQPYAGLFSGKKFIAFIYKRLPDGKKYIENLDIPFCAVCTNLRDGKAYKLCKGDLSKALLASSALPPIVRPVEIDGNLYVDGAVRSNVPTVSAKQFDADIVIAVPVDVVIDPIDIKEFVTVKAVTNRVGNIILSVLDEHHILLADFSVTPDVSDISVLSKKTKDVKKAIKAGEDAATAALPQVRKLMAERANHKISQSEPNKEI